MIKVSPECGINKMNWFRLENEENLKELKSLSRSKFCLIFKYSSRGATSSIALDRLERAWSSFEMSAVQPFFLDLIGFRNLSNRVEEEFNVRHESPQLLLIEKENSVFDTSHFGINYSDIRNVVMTLATKSES